MSDPFTLLPGSFVPGQWEHVTFAPIQIQVPEPATTLLLGMGLFSLAWVGCRRRG